jgi:hypothetical protein
VVSDHRAETLETRAVVASQLVMGFLLGLGPLLLAAISFLAFGWPATAGLPFTLLWGLAGFGLFCFDVVAVIPLLIIASTRRIGLGLAVGFATTCGVIAYIVTHTNWTALFG